MNLNLYWDNHQQQTVISPHDHVQKVQDLSQHEVGKHQYHDLFRCEFCDSSFYSPEELHHHQILHSRRKPYSCDECGSRFPYSSILLWHKKTHLGQLPFKCDECGSQFYQNSTLVWHKRKHRLNNDESCSNDNQIDIEGVPTQNNFYHEQSSGPLSFPSIPPMPSMFSVPNILSGQVLQVGNKQVAPLTSHHRPMNVSVIQHPNNINAAPNVPESIANKEKPQGDFFSCTICSASFKYSDYLKSHMVNKHRTGHNNPYYQLGPDNPNWRSSVNKRKKYSEKPFKCDLCGAAFLCDGHLKEHRLEHTQRVNFKCRKCDQSFLNQFQLEYHERRHPPERPHKCSMCGASFHKISHLTRHIRRHTGDDL